MYLHNRLDCGRLISESRQKIPLRGLQERRQNRWILSDSSNPKQ